MFMGAGKPQDRPVNDITTLADVSEEWEENAAQNEIEMGHNIDTNTTIYSIEDWTNI